MTEGNYACQVTSAMDICDQVILAPALAALSDLSNSPGAVQPQQAGTTIVYVDDPVDCEPLSQDTDGMPVCGGGGDGVDESTTATDSESGTDESTSDATSGGGVGPRSPERLRASTPRG